MPVIELERFDGGVNYRDSYEQLDLSESSDAVNFTLGPSGGGGQESGAAIVRNGCALAVTLPAGTASFLYYSPALDKWFCQVGSVLHVRPGNLSGAWASHIAALGSSAACAMVDFVGTAVVAHPVGGVWTTDGTTATNRSTTAKGNCVSVFKNRAWIGGDPGAKTRLWFSNLGTAVTWTTASDFVDVREKDDEIITALSGAAGSLLVFKKRSHYRVTDAATGAYTTVDWAVGCVGAQALAHVRGFTYAWGADGLYACDGIGRAALVGDKIGPVFAALGDGDVARAGVFEDRAVFATAQGIFEFFPELGGIARHDLASGETIASFARKGSALYAALSSAANMYQFFSGSPGADNGVNFTAVYTIPPIALGKLHRLQHVRVYGRDNPSSATKVLRVAKDWTFASFDDYNLDAALEGTTLEAVADVRSLGHGESFFLQFRVAGGTNAAQFNRARLDLIPLAR